jgi:hypothetical protein
MFITGNGEQLMNLFSGNRENDTYKIYDRTKYDRACVLFCAVLLVLDLIMVFGGDMIPSFSIISVVIVIVSFILFIFYLKNYAKK